MNTFDIDAGRFDRVVSVEMFEHMKNYQALMAAVARWLKPGGHALRPYLHPQEPRLPLRAPATGPTGWPGTSSPAARCPPTSSLSSFQERLALVSDWKVNGTHYQKTAEAWLANMDAHREEILPLFRRTYGTGAETRWWAYWRVFFMSCAELWGYRGGGEWGVSHYLFRKAGPHAYSSESKT